MRDNPTLQMFASLAVLFLLYFGPTQCQRAQLAEQRSAELVKDLDRAIERKDWDRLRGIVDDFATSGGGDQRYEVDNHGWHATE